MGYCSSAPYIPTNSCRPQDYYVAYYVATTLAGVADDISRTTLTFCYLAIPNSDQGVGKIHHTARPHDHPSNDGTSIDMLSGWVYASVIFLASSSRSSTSSERSVFSRATSRMVRPVL